MTNLNAMEYWNSVFKETFRKLKESTYFNSFTVEIDEDDRLVFGDKETYSFKLYSLYGNYLIVSSLKMNTPPELYSLVASLMVEDLNQYDIGTIISCGKKIYYSTERVKYIHGVFEYLLKNLKREDIQFPGYSIYPLVAMQNTVMLLSENKYFIKDFKTMEEAEQWVENELIERKKLREAEEYLDKYLLSCTDNVDVYHSQFSTLYHKSDVFSTGFNFSKTHKEDKTYFEGSYHFDNKYYNVIDESLDVVISKTINEIKLLINQVI